MSKDVFYHKSKMDNEAGRRGQAIKIMSVLLERLPIRQLAKANVLDVGSYRGVISHELAKFCAHVEGIDINADAIAYAKKKFEKGNVHFGLMDVRKLKFKSESFDVVIATQVVSQVLNPEVMFSEIWRVLRPGGFCYVASANKFNFRDSCYGLPFLPLLPSKIANWYIKLSGKQGSYETSYLSLDQLAKATSKFEVERYTVRILSDPKKYGFNSLERFEPFLKIVPSGLFELMERWSPTFIWLLRKRD